MTTILDPTFLFITQKEWLDPDKRDSFLEHFFENMDFVCENQLCHFFWSNELDDLLMGNVYSPPWISDANWGNRFIPIIFNSFNPLKQLIEVEADLSPCNIKTDHHLSDIDLQIKTAFLRLAHKLLIENQEFVYYLGCQQALVSKVYEFFCDCHSLSSTPKTLAYPSDWLGLIDPVTECWPSCSGDGDKLRLAIEIVLTQQLSKNKDEIVYSYDFENKFLEDVIQEKNHRKDFLYAVSKRLSKRQDEAVKDSGLRDEPVKGKKNKKGERRFRVTGECRIHYKIVSSKFIFLRFYGEGQHDDGL